MGNYKSKSDTPVSPPVAALFKTAETKSRVLLEKYLDERGIGGDGDSGLAGVRLMRMWASGRTVGRRAVDKIVGEDLDGELGKVNKARLSWLLARLLGRMAGEGEEEQEVESYCDFIRQEVEFCWGQEEEEERERLRVLAGKVGDVLKVWNDDLMKYETGLRRWAEWLAARVATEVARGNVGEAFRIAREGKRTFIEAFRRLELCMKEKRLGLELKEMSYYTFPGEGMKRWWIDLMVTMVEREPKFSSVVWRSSAYKFDQCCLTRGFPPSLEFIPGCSKDDHYLSAWDCQANKIYQCNDEFRCVKCGFVSALLDKLLSRTISDLSWMADGQNLRQVTAGLKTFAVKDYSH